MSDTSSIKTELLSLEAALSVNEMIERDDALYRRKIATYIIIAFIVVNLLIILIVSAIFGVESYMIAHKEGAYDRVVDNKTIMTLIGATTVQLGAISLAVSNWLFKKRT